MKNFVAIFTCDSCGKQTETPTELKTIEYPEGWVTGNLALSVVKKGPFALENKIKEVVICPTCIPKWLLQLFK